MKMLWEVPCFDPEHSCACKELYEVPGGDLVVSGRPGPAGSQVVGPPRPRAPPSPASGALLPPASGLGTPSHSCLRSWTGTSATSAAGAAGNCLSVVHQASDCIGRGVHKSSIAQVAEVDRDLWGVQYPNFAHFWSFRPASYSRSCTYLASRHLSGENLREVGQRFSIALQFRSFRTWSVSVFVTVGLPVAHAVAYVVVC